MMDLRMIDDKGYTGYRTAGNEKTAFLKVLALILMVIDHCGVIFFRGVMEWRVIGRLAFPIYAWCLVVGMGYTRNPIRYSLRLLSVAVISQFFYMKALNHGITEFNVIFTLWLGQLAVYGLQRRKFGSQFWAPALALAVSLILKVDYGFKGVLVVILLYLAKDTKHALIGTMVAFCLFWGEGTSLLNHLFGLDLTGLKTLTAYSSSFYSAVFRLQNFAVLSLPLILFPIGWSRRHPAWLSYIAYPGHLLILWLLKAALQ